jgi:glycosyltransferase involved in cell wall biosynthesis
MTNVADPKVGSPTATGFVRDQRPTTGSVDVRGTIRVAHVITGLGTGGAERMLLKLLTHLDPKRFDSRVFSLLPSSGPIAAGIEALSVPVTSLGMGRRNPSPAALLRLGNALRAFRPHLVQTWMYHADLVGGLSAKLTGLRVPVVWNIRHGRLDPVVSRRRTFAVVRVCAMASRWIPHTIICCSNDARETHSSIGYADSKLCVIPNGFDTSLFRPDPVARAAVRAELGVPGDAFLIGMVARFDPQKDHQSFVQAAARLHEQRPGVHFVLCGTRVSTDNQELRAWVDAAGLSSVVHLLGERRDVERINAALDLGALSSRSGEGFPNVLGEAMACGVPCVATDVGDSSLVIGDTGRVIPPLVPTVLADAWRDFVDMDRGELRALGVRARQRIVQQFSIEEVAERYARTYERIVAVSA